MLSNYVSMSCCAVNSPSVHAGGIFDEVDVLVELLLHRLLRVLDRVHESSSLKQVRGEIAFNFKDTEHFWGEDINHVLQNSCYSEQNSSHHVSSAGDCNLVDEGNAGKRERGRVMSWRENGTNRTTFNRASANRGDTLSGCLLSCVKIIRLGFRSGKLILREI